MQIPLLRKTTFGWAHTWRVSTKLSITRNTPLPPPSLHLAAAGAEAVDAAAAAVTEGGLPVAELALVLSPIILYGIFNVYRSALNPRAKVVDPRGSMGGGIPLDWPGQVQWAICTWMLGLCVGVGVWEAGCAARWRCRGVLSKH